MEQKTNFFKKVITSIYDIKVFSKYAKEGTFRAILYATLLTLILVGMKDIFIVYNNNDIEIRVFIYTIVMDSFIAFLNLLFDCLIVALITSIFAMLMKMVVKPTALYSLTLYAATLPLIIQTILEAVNSNISFDTMFIIGTITYVTLILKYIKDEILNNIS